MTSSEYSRPVSLEQLAKAPVDLVLDPSPTECEALADRFELVALPRLSGAVAARLLPGGDVVVEGRIDADVVQECVVSGQPVPAHVSGPFSLRLTDAEGLAAWEEAAEPGAEDVDLLDGHGIDLGEIAAQSLALMIDPYPRAAGVDIPMAPDMEDSQDDHPINPFAVLKDMKGA